jgi:hypothetical protein
MSVQQPLEVLAPIKSDTVVVTDNVNIQIVENKPKMAGYTWTWLGALLLWFIIFTVIFWLIYYSLKPSFVLQNDSNQIDTAKVLLAAVITALILIIIIWLIRLAIGKRY